MPSVAVFVAALSLAQTAAPALEQRLRIEFMPTKFETKRGQMSVAQPGVVLVVLHNDIVASPMAGLSLMQNSFKDGKMKHGISSLMRQSATESGSRTLQAGERVFVHKVELKDNSVLFGLICDEMVGGIRHKATVSFQFPKGYLASPEPGQPENSIARVFRIEQEGSPQGGQRQPVQPQTAPLPPIEAPPPPPELSAPPPQGSAFPAIPAGETKSIQMGQTTQQVVVSFGPPLRTATLGVKTIYFYQDMKVTFVNGKVADVE